MLIIAKSRCNKKKEKRRVRNSTKRKDTGMAGKKDLYRERYASFPHFAEEKPLRNVHEKSIIFSTAVRSNFSFSARKKNRKNGRKQMPSQFD